MKQKEKRKKKTKGARNKIKEMLFHNANCAASITPQLAPVPSPPSTSGINVECQANEATSSNCRRRRAPKRNMEMRREIRKMRYLM